MAEWLRQLSPTQEVVSSNPARSSGNMSSSLKRQKAHPCTWWEQEHIQYQIGLCPGQQGLQQVLWQLGHIKKWDTEPRLHCWATRAAECKITGRTATEEEMDGHREQRTHDVLLRSRSITAWLQRKTNAQHLAIKTSRLHNLRKETCRPK